MIGIEEIIYTELGILSIEELYKYKPQDPQESIEKVNVLSRYNINWKLNEIKQIILQEFDSKNITLTIPDKFPVPYYTYTYRNIKKILNILSDTNFSLLYPDKSLISVVFNITNTSISETVNYAFIYARLLSTSLFDIDSICFGNLVSSKDGEYRSRFVSPQTITYIFTTYRQLYDDIEDYLLPQLQKIYKLDFKIYMNKSVKPISTIDIKEILSGLIKQSRYQIYLFVIVWLLENIATYYNIQSEYIIDSYKKMFVYDESQAMIKSLILKYTDISFLSIYYKSMTVCPIIQVGEFSQNYEMWGHKILPLTVDEIQNPYSNKYSTWRELNILALNSDLLVNGICQHLAFAFSWFFVYNTSVEYFDLAKQLIQEVKSSELEQSRLINRFKESKDKDSILVKNHFVLYNLIMEIHLLLTSYLRIQFINHII